VQDETAAYSIQSSYFRDTIIQIALKLHNPAESHVLHKIPLLKIPMCLPCDIFHQYQTSSSRFTNTTPSRPFTLEIISRPSPLFMIFQLNKQPPNHFKLQWLYFLSSGLIRLYSYLLTHSIPSSNDFRRT